MLSSLVSQLISSPSHKEKVDLLLSTPPVCSFFRSFPMIEKWAKGLSLEMQLLLSSLIAIGEGERLLTPFSEEQATALLLQIVPVERLYAPIGGIVGYQHSILTLMGKREAKEKKTLIYHIPPGIDLSKEDYATRRRVIDGIKALPFMVELYPLGGAADRLSLQDEKEGKHLPAAHLPFLGKSLLQGIIEDLQAREYLYYKLFHEQIIVPVAIMTSEENHSSIIDLLDCFNWLGRSRKNFRFFIQPLVPTFDREGKWQRGKEALLHMKPGGHGVIWWLAAEEGIFDWFFSLGKKKGMVRQINNPVAAVDQAILAYMGTGYSEDRWLGFLASSRIEGAAEGANVLLEEPTDEGIKYTLTQVEYCDFDKFGPSEISGNYYSQFPSNSNILFIDLAAILKVIRKNPFPGTIINLKKNLSSPKGKSIEEEKVVRLESTMQAVADLLGEVGVTPDQLRTFVAYNVRSKTLSAIKRKYTYGTSLLETAEGCFLDVLANNRQLLEQNCRFSIEKGSSEQTVGLIFLYHPSLGPLYSIIAQKIRGGRATDTSELQLQIAEVDIENLSLEGSLLISAKEIMGHLNEQKEIEYSENCGRVTLHNVTVCNKGIDRRSTLNYWKNEIVREESCSIFLNGNSSFYAENIRLKGNQIIEIPEGIACYMTPSADGGIRSILEPIADRSLWHWEFRIDDLEAKIILNKVWK